MHCPPLTELPPPRTGSLGWPWTIGTAPLPDAMPDGQPWPSISIVTPSFNQGQFIEHAIRSVLLQGYPRLELIVVDGGSSDDTGSVMARYAPWFKHWVSEPDHGPPDALNKGFRVATGDILGYLNADDFYLPGSLEKVATAFRLHPKADVVAGHGFFTDEAGALGARVYSDPWNLTRFSYGACVLFQPSTFFRRPAFESVGGFKPSRSTWDMELWADLGQNGAGFETEHEYLAAFRLHTVSITGTSNSRPARVEDALIVRERLTGHPTTPVDRFLSSGFRIQRFARHPLRTLRQRLYFHSTLGSWSL